MGILIIAEAGVNHNGDIELAKRLITIAAEAGCDAVKFQTFSANDLVTRNAKKANYQEVNDGAGTQFEMLKRLELNEEEHLILKRTCQQHGIEFLSTAFGINELRFLVELGIRHVKIPSGELTNLPLLLEAARTGLPILMSTGMADLAEVEASLDALVQGGCDRSLITVLHCTSLYPAPVESVNLLAMQTIKAKCNVSVGYSDHTLGDEIAIAAAALGATVIEKHFTLNRDLAGPDHQASLEPDELREMVRAIRRVEMALGNGRKQPDPKEWETRRAARRSIVARQEIRPGEVLGPDNITCKRPGSGISPMRWDDLIGRRASRSYQPDEHLDEMLP
jgi:N-acetylneuraminate synthase